MREELRHILDLKWNSYSRLALLDYYDPERASQFPFLAWGLSSKYKGWLPRQYLITIDGASETPITELERDVRFHDYLAWDITSLPYHIRLGKSNSHQNQNPPPNFLSSSIWYHIVVFYKNQARQAVIFFLIDRKISSTANFGRIYPSIMCYCGGGQVVALKRMAPVLAWQFSFALQPITLMTGDFLLTG